MSGVWWFCTEMFIAALQPADLQAAPAATGATNPNNTPTGAWKPSEDKKDLFRFKRIKTTTPFKLTAIWGRESQKEMRAKKRSQFSISIDLVRTKLLAVCNSLSGWCWPTYSKITLNPFSFFHFFLFFFYRFNSFFFFFATWLSNVQAILDSGFHTSSSEMLVSDGVCAPS